MNILEQIVDMCESRHTSDLRTNQQLNDIKRLARQNVNMLTQILLRLHSPERT